MKALFFTLSALLPTTLCLAQRDTSVAGDPASTPKKVEPTNHVLLSDVLGAKVFIAPGTEARSDAAKDGKTAKPVDGKLTDLLVDHATGQVECAVVEFGGFLGMGDKTVVVPKNLLSWHAAEKAFALAATEDQLKACADFDLSKARAKGLDNEITVARGGWSNIGWREVPNNTANASVSRTERRVGDGVDVKDKDVGSPNLQGTSFVAIPGRLVAASEIDDYPVYALGEKFGKISRTIVDGCNRIAMHVVSHGGALGMGDTEYLIPHSALVTCKNGNDTVLCFSRPSAQIKSDAPKYEKPSVGVVDPSAAKRAEEVFADLRR